MGPAETSFLQIGSISSCVGSRSSSRGRRGVIAIGFLIAFLAAIRHVVRREEWAEIYLGLRVSLGRSLMLGIEFLVAADIIGTVAVQPTLENLAALGVP
ncbi:MAG: DUF1622 domain-containing protein [Hyphomicrobium sp.]